MQPGVCTGGRGFLAHAAVANPACREATSGLEAAGLPKHNLLGLKGPKRRQDRPTDMLTCWLRILPIADEFQPAAVAARTKPLAPETIRNVITELLCSSREAARLYVTHIF